MAVALMLAACAGGSSPEFGQQQTGAKTEIEETKASADLGHEPAVGPAEAPEPEMPLPEGTEAEAVEIPVEPTEPVDPMAPVHFKTATLEEPEPVEMSLFEAAEAERQRRQGVRKAQLVITDANLKEHGRDAELTELIVEGMAETADSPATAEDSSGERADPETYWRTRIRDARLAWRAGADRIVELDAEVAKLRYDFYAADDPFYRDSEIKPAWDRAAVDLQQARLRVKDLELAVRSSLEEGVSEGALPGWLREGIDFEPESTEKDRRDRQELEPALAIEPPIAEDPPR